MVIMPAPACLWFSAWGCISFHCPPTLLLSPAMRVPSHFLEHLLFHCWHLELHMCLAPRLCLLCLSPVRRGNLYFCVSLFFSRWPPGVAWACTNSSEFAAKHFEKRNRSFVFPLKRACPIPSILLISAPLLKVQLCQQVGGLGGQSSFPWCPIRGYWTVGFVRLLICRHFSLEC